jgi:hypothetical protein
MKPVTVASLRAQLKTGTQVEKEHTNDLRIARQIALDHLFEFPDYYTRLRKMEKQAKKDWRKRCPR